jgi:hypothetical protein
MLDLLERLATIYVVIDDDLVGAAGLQLHGRPEWLLPGHVSDLQFDRVAFELDLADLEISTDRRDGVVAEHVLGKTEKKAGLADVRVPDDSHLEATTERPRERYPSREREEMRDCLQR